MKQKKRGNQNAEKNRAKKRKSTTTQQTINQQNSKTTSEAKNKPIIVWHGHPTDFALLIHILIVHGLITTLDGKKNVSRIMKEFCSFMLFESERNNAHKYVSQNSMVQYSRNDSAEYTKEIVVIRISFNSDTITLSIDEP